jgi:hypothetical protein
MRRCSSNRIVCGLSVLTFLLFVIVLSSLFFPVSFRSVNLVVPVSHIPVVTHVLVENDDLASLCALESLLFKREGGMPVYVWSANARVLRNEVVALLAHIYDKRGRLVLLQHEVKNVWDILYEVSGEKQCEETKLKRKQQIRMVACFFRF